MPRITTFVPIVLGATLLLACSGEKQAPNVTVTAPAAAPDGSATPAAATPSISLTPAPGAPADLALARRLEAEGDIENAVNAYVAVAAADPASRGEALLAAARLLLELERPADARALLEPQAGELDPAAHYLMARAFHALEMPAEALAQYDAYIAAGGPALPYAYLDRANVLLDLDDSLGAVESAQTGLDIGVPVGARGRFRVTIAGGYERLGELEQAIEWYRRLYETGLFADQTFALSRIVQLKLIREDPSYWDDLLHLLGEFPSSSYALQELNLALERGEPVPPFLEGLVHYRQNDYTAAEPAFRAQIEREPAAAASADAYYYLAAIQESRGEAEEAMANYELAGELNPDSPIADDALWWRARLHEIAGDLQAAEELLDRLLDEYPASSWADDAAFRRGMLPYVNGEFEAAASLWAEEAPTAGGLQAARLSLWQAKALLAAGREEQARVILEALASANGNDYYGVRARSLLAGSLGQPSAVTGETADLTPEFDWQAAEQWLVDHTGLPLSSDAWLNDPRWARVQELWRVGRRAQADLEAHQLLTDHADDPIAMYTLARELEAEGRFSVSARAGEQLLLALGVKPNQGLPRALLSLAYPAAFGEQVERFAAEAGTSPLLLLAFVRQESSFQPRAISGAGALGLTQLLPANGERVAAELGITDFDASQLLHADLSLRLGAHHMANHLSHFNDEIFVALAAYNAGAGPAERWREVAGTDDPDVYLEMVEFEETRIYLHVVSENYAMYRYLYGNQPEPNLPSVHIDTNSGAP